MLDDLRKTIEATFGELSPTRAKSLAKSLAGPGAAKEQVARSGADLIEWSQKNRERLREFIRREVSKQVGAVGVATQSDLDALKKRVRVLERAGGKGRTSSTKSTSKRMEAATKAATAKAAPPATKKKPGAAVSSPSAGSTGRGASAPN